MLSAWARGCVRATPESQPRGPALVQGATPPGRPDALTDEEFSDFDPANRIRLDPAVLPFKILPELARVSEEIYGDIRRRRASSAVAASSPSQTGKFKQPLPPMAPARNRRRPLRERDPWQ